jgi:hypothetical protein
MWGGRLRVKLQRRGSAQWLRKSGRELRAARGFLGDKDGEFLLPFMPGVGGSGLHELVGVWSEPELEPGN